MCYINTTKDIGLRAALHTYGFLDFLQNCRLTYEMNDANFKSCYPCENKGYVQKATKWCSNCKINMCNECTEQHNSMRPDDHVITVQERERLESIEVKDIWNCVEHDREKNLYCRSHDDLICITCAQTSHVICKPAVPVTEVSNQIGQTSTSITILEQDVQSAIKTLKEQIVEKTENKNELEQQKMEILEIIRNTRQNIEAKLRLYEESIILELNTKYKDCNSELDNFLELLSDQTRRYTEVLEKIDILKNHGTSSETFIGTWKLNKDIMERNELFIDLTEKMDKVSLNIAPNSNILVKCEEMGSFGEIEVNRTKQKSLLLSTNSLQVPSLEQLCIPSTTLGERKSVILPKPKGLFPSVFLKTEILSCAILPNLQMVFMDSNQKRIIIIDKDANFVGETQLGDKPFDVVVIPSRNVSKFAVSFPWSSRKRVDIMTTDTDKPEQSIGFPKRCFGVSYSNVRLYVVTEDMSISVVNLQGDMLSTLNIVSNGMRYIHVDDAKLYLSNEKTDSVHCYDLKGNELWKIQDSSLKSPRAITSDGRGHIFVACYASNSIFSVQTNGTNMKKLLDFDGLENPVGIHYSRDTKTILTCNCVKGQAFYFDDLSED